MSRSRMRQFGGSRAWARGVAALLALAALAITPPAAHAAAPDGAAKGRPGAKPYPHDRELRLNQIQSVGTHNSYKPGPEPGGLPPSLQENLPYPLDLVESSIDYRHRPMAEQAGRLQMRHMELDVNADPKGGRYVNTPLLTEVGGPARLKDPAWRKPGMKVFHLPQIDQRTTCVRFTDCLRQLKKWSHRNPGHLPFTVFVEIKDTPLLGGLMPTPPQWKASDYDALDAEIRSVFNDDQLITPDDVQGNHPTLESAVLDNGWPTLAKSRGKFMFVNCNCLANDRHRTDYLRPDGSLHDRVMFPTSKPGNPDAAVVLMEDPVKDRAKMQELVRAGYLIRTRTDANTAEARSGDTTRRDAAFASGAQIIDTDYPEPDPRINPTYGVRVPGGTAGRCNPVNAPRSCTALDVENPAHRHRGSYRP
ncbi:Ca2+-dependent phosphoinositide-specific phospholipase C [Streptomyces sp. 796.1]|uniref:Ca2+-dependent phosphoinositide-specific phospholipase C n=1 Tax=Streptomyces sp. 796.1 TaxID=3163029 RepID=UPI0039C99689